MSIFKVRDYVSGWLYSSLLLPAMFFSAACQTATPASQCFLVDLQQKDGAEALPILGDFASSHGLTADRTNPLVPRYQLLNGDKLVAEISYRMGMGEFGAELAFFQYQPEKSEALVAAFASFVEGNLSKSFATRRCSDVPGYANPIAYR